MVILCRMSIACLVQYCQTTSSLLPPQTRRNRLHCHSHAFEVAEMWYIPLPRPPVFVIVGYMSAHHRIADLVLVVMLVGPHPRCDAMHDAGGKAKI